MVRPSRFAFNEETAANNAFQQKSQTAEEALRIQRQAVEEFDAYVTLLRENGITVESSLGGGSGKLLGANYRIFRDGTEIARAESTGQYPHEEDMENHKVASALGGQGFYRVWTTERNLDLLFMTLVAFARTGAMDAKGGTFGAIAGTIRKNLRDE